MAVPSLRWDAAAGRYRMANGRFLAASRVRQELDRYHASLARETSRLATDLRAGRISLESWRMEMKRIIRTTHVNMARIARGGRAQMDNAANGRVGQVIRSEYGYLEQWVTQIRGGWVLDGRLTARARQYAAAGRDTFEAVQREEMLKRGMDEELNVLDPNADHCQGAAGCPAQTALGWVPLGTLIPIGRRTCRRGCRCHLAYRRAREVTRVAA